MTHRPGDRVFAKIKGFSNWPARINPLPPDVQIPKGKLPVFFYGTYQVSFVPPKNIVPYEKFKDKWGKPKANPQFTAAMQEIELNPGIFMLGEDPRAESFLLQFYAFKPSSSEGPSLSSGKQAREDPVKEKNLGSLEDVSSLSDTTNPPVVASSQHRSTGSRKGTTRADSNSEHTAAPAKPALESREHLSETSSEFSSAFSKQDSAEVIDDDVSDDDTTTRQSHNQGASTHPSDGEDESQSASIAHSIDHTEPLGGFELDSESREARRIARKQKKAERRAKKAAKREAKRLVKEQERAEKHARREAKRELKRLHRLRKQQQLAASDYHQEEYSNDGMMIPSPSTLDWTLQAGIDPVAGGDLSPTLDACIEAELQQGNITPISDRPTSPLRLEDYPAVECYEDLAMLHSIEDLNESGRNSSEAASPSEIHPLATEEIQKQKNYSAKRTLNEASFSHETPKSDESDDVLPKKRPKADYGLSGSSPASSKAPKPDASITQQKPKDPSDVNTVEDQDSEGKNSIKVKASYSRCEKTHVSRRRLLSDSSEGEEVVEEVKKKYSPTHHVSSELSPVALEGTNHVAEENPREANQPSPRSKSRDSSATKLVKRSDEPSDRRAVKKESHMNNRNQSPKRKMHRLTSHSAPNSQKSNELDSSKNTTPRTPKKSHTPEKDAHATSPGSPSIVTQLCQICRDLKASLVRGHENFTLAVGYLTQLATIPARLPELAEAWDLMNCIKKCRRYKLSAEVREAAEKTLKSFQSIRSKATKEELEQTKALITAHQQRQNTAQESANRLKQSTNPVPQMNHVDLTTSISAPAPETSIADPPTGKVSPSASQPPTSTAAMSQEISNTPSDANTVTASPDSGINSISADLNAKVDDVLSRIRAAEQRMAAAAAATSVVTNRPGFVHVPDKSYGNGHTIRASAVAAAAAHIRDEEDEESIVSRIEQVAAYEAAAASKVSNLPVLGKSESSSSPPPPPPPLPVKPSETKSPTALSSSPPVDLDLDSRIERLITRPTNVPDSAPPPPPPPIPQRSYTDNGHTSHLPPALLARRAAIANKLAAAKFSGTSTAYNATNSIGSVSTDPKGDDEIYNLLGV